MFRFLRVNMATKTCVFEDIPEEYAGLGGRALTSTIVAREVNPICTPLGPHNKLVFAPGLLGATNSPNGNRISVGCKSPLTEGIKEANSGGQPGGHPIFLAGTAPRGLDFARRTRRRRGMAGALRLLQSHGRRKTGPPARRPVEIAERRRIVCALERPQPGLRRRSDTAAIQCNNFRPGIIKKRPAALRGEPPNHVLI